MSFEIVVGSDKINKLFIKMKNFLKQTLLTKYLYAFKWKSVNNVCQNIYKRILHGYLKYNHQSHRQIY
jgi:hypothetical protein